MAEKEPWWREESIISCPKEEYPISEVSKKILSLGTLKRILSMRNLKRTLITVKTKDDAINGDSQELQDPPWILRRKLLFLAFWQWYMIEWMMSINFQINILVLEGLVFMLPVTERSHPYCRGEHKLFLFT